MCMMPISGMATPPNNTIVTIRLSTLLNIHLSLQFCFRKKACKPWRRLIFVIRHLVDVDNTELCHLDVAIGGRKKRANNVLHVTADVPNKEWYIYIYYIICIYIIVPKGWNKHLYYIYIYIYIYYIICIYIIVPKGWNKHLYYIYIYIYIYVYIYIYI